MTIDKTLKVARGMARSRSVLTRAERLSRLKEADRWQEGDSPVGLPKVRVYKLSMKKKKKKEAEEGAAGAAAPAAAGAKKAAAPAAAAGAAKKPAAPAKK
jgi:small basic protein (TIGR04137 family)